MAYADPQPLAPRKIVSIVIVAILHVVVGYAFITGLAYNVVKQVAKNLDVIDVKEPPPPPEKPPPPPPEQKVEPPPVVAPPPIVAPPQISAPTIVSVPTPPPPVVITPTAPPAPPPPPAPPVVSKAASARGNENSWVSSDDYPPNALRNNEAGRVSVSFTINTTGHVEACQVTSGSGFSDLDETTCRLLTRRGKYSPATDTSGAPIAQKKSLTYRWVIPAE